MTKTILRNLATAYGVYIASWWVAYPLADSGGDDSHTDDGRLAVLDGHSRDFTPETLRRLPSLTRYLVKPD